MVRVSGPDYIDSEDDRQRLQTPWQCQRAEPRSVRWCGLVFKAQVHTESIHHHRATGDYSRGQSNGCVSQPLKRWRQAAYTVLMAQTWPYLHWKVQSYGPANKIPFKRAKSLANPVEMFGMQTWFQKTPNMFEVLTKFLHLDKNIHQNDAAVGQSTSLLRSPSLRRLYIMYVYILVCRPISLKSYPHKGFFMTRVCYKKKFRSFAQYLEVPQGPSHFYI